MANSSLVDVTILSPNYSTRTQKISKITIHHCAGNCSVETIGNIFKPASRKASSNYGIGTDGRVGLYVEEKNRAWTSGSAENDQQAITIEVSNNSGAPNWTVSDKAYAKLIDLCVDICQRNGIKSLNWTGDKTGNLTCHYMFQATACPGPYLKGKMGDIAIAVNQRLKSVPTPQPQPQNDFISQVAEYVNKYRKKYNIYVASPIIGQAINESAMGTSELAKNAKNFFGLKYRPDRCPTSNGIYLKDAVEQMANGSYIIQGGTEWFKFPDLENSVIGYFDFTNVTNYYNLKGVTDPETYLINLKSDGYGSQKDYVQRIMNVINKYNLTQYDVDDVKPKPAPTPVTEFPYLVRINTDVLNVRSGPGTAYPIKTTVRRGQVYTIVDEENGGAWGKLKSGAGFICLAYTIKC